MSLPHILILLVLLVFTIVPAYAYSRAAMAGRTAWPWAVVAVLLGPLAWVAIVIAAALVASRKHAHQGQ